MFYFIIPPPPLYIVKLFQKVLLFMAVGMALTACGGDDEPVNVTLALDKTSLSISSDELEPTDINVTASGGDWTAASNVEWLRAEKVDNETLRVSYDKNNKEETREGIITAAIGEVSGTINVTQEGVKLILAENALAFPAEEHAKDIAVTARGGEWTAASDADWLSTENVDNETLRVRANANMNTESRTGSVTTSLGEVIKTLTVTQDGAPEDNTEQNPGNTAPVITPGQTFSVAENVTNGTAVGTVLASDAETNNLMFAITQGNTGNVFAINEGTGALTTAGALDFENTSTYTLTVSVSD
ncbi:MAG: cadherin domain-containing protein, partial [Ekhidna sp.]|nr:cadherin domain-containing protein [Ekhidna sp.]